jgi:hypothetical protein
MPTEVKLGQKWATWVSSRSQWLLATVIHQEKGEATLKYDARYGIARGYDEQKADEATMLTHTNLFRFVEPESCE